MKPSRVCLMAMSLSCVLIRPATAQVEDGLKTIAALAQVNGQALACEELQAAARAKALMLRHAPKTARFGATFDDGTHASYLAHIRNNAPCPDAASLSMQLTTLALQLQASLPVAPVANTPISPTTP